MFGFFKPKKRDLKPVLADIIEHAMITKRFLPGSDGDKQFMTCVLYDYGILGLNWITIDEVHAMQEMLVESYNDHKIVLAHVSDQDPYLTWDCGEFGLRIVISNHYWQLIRKLRGQPPLNSLGESACCY